MCLQREYQQGISMDVVGVHVDKGTCTEKGAQRGCKT
jgi:hypothetical protein